MSHSSMFVGLDVHKDSIDVALAPRDSTEVRSYGTILGDLEAVDKVIRKLKTTSQSLHVVSAIHVPGPEDESIRDLTRAREDAVAANRRARPQNAGGSRLGLSLSRQGRPRLAPPPGKSPG